MTTDPWPCLGDRLRVVLAEGLPGSTSTAPDAPASTEVWRELIGQVAEHRLSGLLLAAVASGGLPATQEQIDEAADLHVQAMCTTVVLERELLHTAAILAGASIDLRILKGSAVARLDYADPALRPFIDVDLLVRSEQFDDAVRVLSSSGFRRRYPQPRDGFDRRFSKGASFWTPSGMEIDLHRTFVMGPFGLRLQSEQLWDRAQTFDIAGHPLQALAAEERLLHACYHAALGDSPPRLLPHRDVAEMLLFGDHDEERVASLMRAWGAEPVVARAVRGAWSLLQLADVVAWSAWADRFEPNDQQAHEMSHYTHPANNYAAKSLASLRAIPRLRDKAAFITALAFPQPRYVSQRHSGFLARLRHGMDGIHADRSR